MIAASPLPAVHDLPPMEGPIVVVGDVHLSPRSPEVVAAFRSFLAGLVRGPRVAHLVLLGDVFDAWVGDAQRREPIAAEALTALREVAATGTRIAFQAGNRDFLFRAGGDLPIDIWPDVVRTTWGARRVLLTHGDLLCTADVAYQRMRRVVRGRLFTTLARVAPHLLRRWVGRLLRGVSRGATRRAPRGSLGLDYAEARRWMEAFGADLLVAGHVHTGVHHRLTGAEGVDREVVVLKDWERGANVVRFENETVRLVAIGG